MCDYSLEGYKSRAAVDGEELVVKQFPSGSRGFVEPRNTDLGAAFRDSDCAVCCKDGVEMTLFLHGATLQTRSLRENGGLGDDAQDEKLEGETPVKFHTLAKFATKTPWGVSQFGYRDGFILPNGRFMLVQALKAGTRATVTKALPKEITEAVKGDVAFKEELRITDVVPLVTEGV
jgi:hypothetical protein